MKCAAHRRLLVAKLRDDGCGCRQFGMAEHDNQLEAAVEAVQSVGCRGTSSAGSCQCQDRMAERRIREGRGGESTPTASSTMGLWHHPVVWQ